MNEFLSPRTGPARHGLVIGINRAATAAISQTLAADGFHTSIHHPVHWPDTVAHLRHAAGDVVVFLCPHAVCAAHPPINHSSINHTPTAHVSSCDCLLPQLRADGNRRPVLAIAARGSADTWPGCHQAGANDYLAAPPQDPVLLAHVRALSRYSSSQFAAYGSGFACPPLVELDSLGSATVHGSQLKVGDLTLDPATRMACRGQKPSASRETPSVVYEKKLPRCQALLLELLMRHKGQLLSVERILAEVWPGPDRPASNIVAKTIERVRNTVDVGFDTRLIHNVPGKGYVVEAEQSETPRGHGRQRKADG